MTSNMKRRVLVAGIAIPAALGVVYVGGWALAGALALLGVAGSIELYRIAEKAGIRPVREVGLPAAALVPLAAFAASPDGVGLAGKHFLFAGVVFVLLVMGVAVVRRAPSDRPLPAVAITIFGAIYTSGLLSFLVLLRHPQGPVTPWAGTWLVFLPLVVVWVCDSAAMTGGSMMGGPKFAPVVSPNKTWSGTISGSAVATVLGPIYGWLFLAPVGVDMAIWQLAIFGFIVSAVGQIGDLAESLFKREVGVKDSGTFFPGHGGVLDRLDSLYWAIPTAAILLTLFEVI